MKKFLKEERGQGAIEYIMLAGGIIVAAIVIFVLYKQGGQQMGWFIEATGNETYQRESMRISEQLEKL